MSHDHCDNLDAFLADDLSRDAVLRFTAHLDECESCRDAVDQQRWIDTLLRSPLRIELESPPAALIERAHQSMSQRRRPIRLIACVLAAAAALVVAAGWTTLLIRQANGPNVVVVNNAAVTQPHKPPLPAPLRSTFVGGPNVLVVPLESPHPNVTIVRVFPTFELDYAAHASADTPAAIDEFTWPIDLNGG